MGNVKCKLQNERRQDNVFRHQSAICSLQFAICNARFSRRRGILLVVVLVVIALLSLGGYTFCQLMQSERDAVELTCRQTQARALADSGIEAARLFIAETKNVQNDAGGSYDNPQRFRGALVIDDALARERGRFTLLVSQGDHTSGAGAQSGMASGVRYGLEDQSNRLNINALTLYEKLQSGSSSGSSSGSTTASKTGSTSGSTSSSTSSSTSTAGRKMLMQLPGMTEQIADAILDWLDTDSTTREFGAESEYYSTLSPAYAPRNGPLASIEELLLVKGVTPALLFGVDANRNGYADRGESDPMSMENVDNSDRSMDRGWSAYLTLWSMERNVQSDGTARININQTDMQDLYNKVKDALSEDWAKFILAYRQNGPPTSTNNNTSTTVPISSLDITPSTSSNSKNTLKTVLDLVGAKALASAADSQQQQQQQQRQQQQQQSQQRTVSSPVAAGDASSTVMTLLDKLTVYPSKTIPARININGAPRLVLLMIPGMTEKIADDIIAKRTPDPVQADPNRINEGWILSEGVVTLEEMKSLLPYICAGGDVYRAESVGFYESVGPTARVEAILDATASPPAVLFWRDVSHLGRAYPADVLGMESM